MAYDEMSREEAGNVFFRSPTQPQVSPAESVPQVAPTKPIPVKAGKSSSAKINTESLVSDVAAGAKQMQKEAPKPELISPIDTFVNEITSNWKPLAIGAGVAVGGELLRRSIQNKAFGKSSDVSKVTERVDPVFVPEPVPEQPANKLEQLQKRAEAGREAGLGQTPIQGAAAPQTAPAPVPAPVATQPAPQAPTSVTEAVATGQSPAKAIQTDVAQLIDETPTPAESKVAQRVRRTNAQIEESLKEAFAKAPPGMRPAAPAKTNKLPGDVIGQGGWHWYQGQMGPEAEEAWLRQFGRTPQTYADVKQAVKEGRLPVPAPVEGKKGGTHPRQEFVPEYIKGNASLMQLGNLAANALGAAGLIQAYKQGQQTGDWSDLGLGAIGQVLGNVAPRAGLGFSLMAPGSTNEGEQQELAKRRKKKATID